MNINFIHDYGFSLAGNHYQPQVKKSGADHVRAGKDILKKDHFVSRQYSADGEKHRKEYLKMNQLAETSTILNIIEVMLEDMEAVLSVEQKTPQQRTNAIIRLENIVRNTTYKGVRLFSGLYSSQLNYQGKYLTLSDDISVQSLKSFQGSIPVNIHRFPVKANYTGREKLTSEKINGGVSLIIKENEKQAELKTYTGQTAGQIINRLNDLCNKFEIEVTCTLSDNLQITVTHNQFGADKTFELCSSPGGFLNERDGEFITVNNGKHIHGSIGFQKTICKNDMMHGSIGSDFEEIALILRDLPENPECISEHKVGILNVDINPLVIYPDGIQTYAYYPENLETFIRDAKNTAIENEYTFNAFKVELGKKADRIRMFANVLREMIDNKKKTIETVMNENISVKNEFDRLKHQFLQALGHSNPAMLNQNIRQYL